MSTKKVHKVHLDIIGRELQVDNYVAYDGYVCRVSKLNEKTVSLINATGRKSAPRHKYGREVALLPDAEVMFWLLSQKPTKG